MEKIHYNKVHEKTDYKKLLMIIKTSEYTIIKKKKVYWIKNIHTKNKSRYKNR